MYCVEFEIFYEGILKEFTLYLFSLLIVANVIVDEYE